MSTTKKYYRAILVLKGTTEEQFQQGLEKALSDIKEKYDPENPNFVGDFEGKEFKKAMEAWEAAGSPVKKYAVSTDDMSGIDFMVNMASVPVNFIEEDTKVMVLGPEVDEELDIHVSSLEEIQ